MLRLHRQEKPPDLRPLAPEASPRLTEAIMHCLEKNPAERLDSATLQKEMESHDK